MRCSLFIRWYSFKHELKQDFWKLSDTRVQNNEIKGMKGNEEEEADGDTSSSAEA